LINYIGTYLSHLILMRYQESLLFGTLLFVVMATNTTIYSLNNREKQFGKPIFALVCYDLKIVYK